MIELIRSSNMAFTNLEMLFHDYGPYPMAVSGGIYMRGDPKLAKELVWAGFDMVSRANNHTGDYGVLGQQLTTKYVREAGLVDAGVGTASEAAQAMELDCDVVLMNTAIAEAKDPVRMARAMNLAVQAGRDAYLAGRMPKKLYADPSSPLAGLI